MSGSAGIESRDANLLSERDISPAEAERQLGLLQRNEVALTLSRACTIDDGILAVPEERQEELCAHHAEAAAEGRFLKFVPASGAATRMFAELLYFHIGEGTKLGWDRLRRQESGDDPGAPLRRFMERLPEFPFHEALRTRLHEAGFGVRDLVAEGDFSTLLAALFQPGLGLETQPKALLPFHLGPEGARTPLEEHLVEAAQTIRDRDGVCRLHFTVSPEHRDALLQRFGSQRRIYEGEYGARFVLGTSEQCPSTDTLALELDGRPARDADGRLLLRPGGHGALIENLSALEADLAYVKNIDNVQPDARKADTLLWKRVLGGLLVEVQSQAFHWIERLEAPGTGAAAVDGALNFIQRTFGNAGGLPPEAGALIDRLDRPIRICGVVRNTGEPGGGPYWVRRSDGTESTQIVEMAQIDRSDPNQQAIVEAATHFNPVDLVCSLRDRQGKAYDLQRFIDPDACFLAEKSVQGRTIRVLERPGLWNGAMARWNTLFVEVPLSTFTPVKTVFDLLRPEHLVRG